MTVMLEILEKRLGSSDPKVGLPEYETIRPLTKSLLDIDSIEKSRSRRGIAKI